MRNNVFYKMIYGACLFGLCVTMTNIASAENSRYWDTPKYTAPMIDHSYNSETDNSRFQAEPHSRATAPWSLPTGQGQSFENRSYENQRGRYSGNQPPHDEPQNGSHRYVRPHVTSQFQQAPTHQTWQQPRQAEASQDRYITPEIINRLNHQEAQHYARLQGERESQFVPSPHSPSYGGRYGQGYPAYGMGSLNPAYDVPAVSPWGESPDVLYSGGQFPWMPNEAVGGVPPIHVPPYANRNEFDGTGNFAAPTSSQVFNPYTFLQNEN